LPVGETSTASKVSSFLRSSNNLEVNQNDKKSNLEDNHHDNKTATYSDEDFVPPTLSSCTSGNEKKFSQEKNRVA